VHRLAAGVVRGDPALLHGRGGQRREADHVAHRVDAGCLGAVVLVHLDPAAAVRGQPGGLQVQVRGHALAARGVHDGLGRDLLAALQEGHRAVVVGLHGGHGLAEPERHGQVAQVVLERLDHFQVAELQHPVALLDHGDLGAQCGEHRGVLDADHPGPGYHHGPRHPLQVLDAVRVDHGPLVERHAGRPGRPGAGGDDDVRRAGRPDPAGAVVDLQRFRAGEPAHAGQDRDPVAGELAADDVVFPADHVPGAGRQVRDGDVFLDPVARPVHLALVQAGQVEHGLAQGLGRDRAGVHADAADHVGPLHDAHPPVQLGSGDGRFLAARTGAYDEHIEVIHATSVTRLAGPGEGRLATSR
jgi:hypothetical protein